MTPAAVGWRPHSGWTVAVIVALENGWPCVLDRRRVELGAPGLWAAPQPYHAAERVAPEERAALVAAAVEGAFRRAAEAVPQLLAEAQDAGWQVTAAGLVGAAPFDDGSVADIMASHARMHAAEGALFQEVLRRACAAAGLPLIGLPEKRLLAEAAVLLGRSGAELEAALAEIGKPLGPPWQKAHRLATLAAWLALAKPA